MKFIAPAGSVVNVVHPGPCVGVTPISSRS